MACSAAAFSSATLSKHFSLSFGLKQLSFMNTGLFRHDLVMALCQNNLLSGVFAVAFLQLTAKPFSDLLLKLRLLVGNVNLGLPLVDSVDEELL